MWDLASKVAAQVNGTYSAGVSSGTLSGTAVNNSFYTAYLMNGAGIVLFLPNLLVHTVSLVGGNTIITLGGHSSWDSTWRHHPNTDGSAAMANYTIRQACLAADINLSGDKVRLTFNGHGSGGNIVFDNISIGTRSGTTSTTVEAVPTEIFTGGASGLTVPQGRMELTDWNDFTVASGTGLLVSLDVSTASQTERYGSLTGQIAYVKSAANWYNLQTFPGGGSSPAYNYYLARIEVMAVNNDYITADDEFNDHRIQQWSADAYDGNIYTILDTVNGTPDQIVIAGDKTAEIKTGDWFQMIPPSGTSCCEIGTVRWANGALKGFDKVGSAYRYRGRQVKNLACAVRFPQPISIAGAVPPNARSVNLNMYGYDDASRLGVYTFLAGSLSRTDKGQLGYQEGAAAANRGTALPGSMFLEEPCMVGAWVQVYDGSWNIVATGVSALLETAVNGWDE